ncbi:MAG: homocysteine S-methyltransferase family protein [Paracoccaceae bacterium]|nr:homocysteine S-methyltransferase family protein [Paracoccaceae bacterium]
MKKIILLDGGMGQELIKRSKSAPHPLWSAQVLKNEPELVENLHIDFIKAGARVISLNSYTATPERLDRDGAKGMFDELQEKAIEVANRARDYCKIADVKIAGCLPPLYGSYKPESAPSLEECIERYQVISNKQAPHVDLFICETMSSIKEAEASIIAARSHSMETWCSLTISDQSDSRLRSNEPLKTAIAHLNKFNHQANLLNCSIPESITVALNCLMSDKKLFGAYANGFASINELEIGGTVDVLKSRQDLVPEAYLQHVMGWIESGARIVGGCCEISPQHIKHIYETLSKLDYEVVSSF